MKLLRVGILCLFVSAAFAQRGGSHGGGGGFSRGGGGGGGFSHGGGFSGGGSRGFSGGGFRGGGFSHGGFNRGFNRGFGSRTSFGFGVGIGYPYWGYGGYGGYGYGWGYPYYADYSGYGYGYAPYAYAGYPGYYDAGYGSAPVVVNQTYAQPAPVIETVPQQYQQYQSPNRETIYLIAFKDHRIQAAVAYWVEANTLNFVTRQHVQGKVPLELVDRSFSEQLNRDQHVDFRLP